MHSVHRNQQIIIKALKSYPGVRKHDKCLTDVKTDTDKIQLTFVPKKREGLFLEPKTQTVPTSGISILFTQ